LEPSRDQKGEPDGHPTHVCNASAHHRRDADPKALTVTSIKTRVGIVEHWRAHRAERKRRVLVQWLRHTANRAHNTDPIRRHRKPLLHYRAAAVRTELLELAAILEHAHDPDRASVAELRDLLSNSSDSPLYNANIPAAELDEALQRIRAGLTHTRPA
jgi:hypothetical protein